MVAGTGSDLEVLLTVLIWDELSSRAHTVHLRAESVRFDNARMRLCRRPMHEVPRHPVHELRPDSGYLVCSEN